MTEQLQKTYSKTSAARWMGSNVVLVEDAESKSLPSRLVECVPTLHECLSAAQQEWTPDELPAVVALGTVGRCLLDRLETVDDDALEALAVLTENVLAHGSEAARDLIATGFLEALLGANDGGSKGDRLLRRLGPLAKAYCEAWDNFCGVIDTQAPP